MIGIKIQKGEWCDEMTDVEPVPALEHVYVLLLMQLGPPDLAWLLHRTGRQISELLQVRDTYKLPYCSEQLLMQFMNWYEREQRLRIRTP